MKLDLKIFVIVRQLWKKCCLKTDHRNNRCKWHILVGNAPCEVMLEAMGFGEKYLQNQVVVPFVLFTDLLVFSCNVVGITARSFAPQK